MVAGPKETADDNAELRAMLRLDRENSLLRATLFSNAL
jgi:hypothetical protein